MKITLKQLQPHLKSDIHHVYFFCGDDRFLLDQADALLATVAKTKGFTECLRMQADKGFDWQYFFTELYTASLFVPRRLIVLDLLQFNLTDDIKTRLLAYLTKPIASHLLLIRVPKLTMAQQNTKWWQSVISQAVVVMIYSLNENEMKTWLRQRLQQANLTLSSEMIDRLQEQSLGNQLALDQAVEKLRLINLSQNIDLSMVSDCIANSAQFDLYQLADYVLLSDTVKIIKTLNYLKESAEPILILWVLLRDIRLMIHLHEQTAKGIPLSQVLTRQGVFRAREVMIHKAFSRVEREIWYKLLEDALHIDLAIKGMRKDNIWSLLENLCLQMSGKKII